MRERETGQSALQIGRYGLGKKGNSSRRAEGGRELREGVLQSHPPPLHRHQQICRSIKREKLRGGVAVGRSVAVHRETRDETAPHRSHGGMYYMRCKGLRNGLSLLSRHSRHPYPSIHPSLPRPCAMLHYTTLSLPSSLPSSLPLTSTSSPSSPSPLTSSISSVMTTR